MDQGHNVSFMQVQLPSVNRRINRDGLYATINSNFVCAKHYLTLFVIILLSEQCLVTVAMCL